MEDLAHFLSVRNRESMLRPIRQTFNIFPPNMMLNVYSHLFMAFRTHMISQIINPTEIKQADLKKKENKEQQKEFISNFACFYVVSCVGIKNKKS